ncbi:histidine kinase [Mariniflexile litorale]|uniref:Histidine kinase n=1 Tax=Mariniflexile litorale TaxID=3045158 RepID=A0AAU7EEK3_9FLAO|nr:histidine kinase [Mariniflexile sp. KMM 9835]MDQ8211995.1 histidine kinase [Mariniflexile sp. KMM 9835]
MKLGLFNLPFKGCVILLFLIFLSKNTFAQVAKYSDYQERLSALIRETTNNPEKGIKTSDSLLIIAKNINDINNYAITMLAKGAALSFMGNNSEALKIEMKAYVIFDSINDVTGKALSLLNIAYVQMHLKKYRKAQDYLLQALNITDKDNSKLLTNIYANLASSSVELKQYNEGIKYYQMALSHFKKIGNYYGVSITYHGISIAYRKLKDNALGKKYGLLALAYQKKTNSDYALSMIALNLGDIYLEQGQLDSSKNYLDIGGKASKKINYPYHKENYYENMAKWYQLKKDYKNAFEYYKKFSVIKDSIYSFENEKASSEIEEKFQNELKTNEIKLLKTQKELAIAEVEKNRFWALILILVTILCMTTIVVLYQNYKGNKKSHELLKLEKVQLAERNQLLESENILVQFETLRTQVSPHFLFNSLNALTSLIKTDKEKALRFTKEFSKIFRNTLELKKKNLTTLKEELEHVNAYLYLQKMRFDSNLNTNINIDSEFFYDYLPPFSLQMVIENAIKHNIITIESPLKIEIKTKDSFLVVTNNLQPRQITEDSTKTGVKNIISRYKYISELEPTFEVIDNLFYVKLPLIKEES